MSASTTKLVHPDDAAAMLNRAASKLLTPDDVATLLQVPKSWIYGRIHAKNLPFSHCKVGHYVRFPEDGVRAFVERQTVAPAAGRGTGRRGCGVS